MQVSFNPTILNNNPKRQNFGNSIADNFVRKVEKGWSIVNMAGDLAEACLGGSVAKSEAINALEKMRKIIPKSRWAPIDNAVEMINNA